MSKFMRKMEADRIVAETARREDYNRREAAFLAGFRALCLEHRIKLIPDAQPSNNITCDPVIDVMPFDEGKGADDPLTQINEFIRP